MAAIVLGLIGLWIGYHVYRHEKRVQRIYDDFANDIDRLESDIMASRDEEMIKAWNEVKTERINDNGRLQEAYQRRN